MATITNALMTGASGGTADTFTSVSGSRGTSSTGSSAAKREVDEAMITYRPYQTPILTKLLSNKFLRKPTGNQKFETMSSTLLPMTDTVTGTGGGTTMVLTVGIYSLYEKGTKVYIDQTGDVGVVTTAAATPTITKVGSGTFTSVATGSLHFLGDSFEQGSASATALSVNKSFLYNYVEIFKKAVMETQSQQSTIEYGPEDWNRNKLDRMEEFKMQLELSFIMGTRGSTPTGVQNGSFSQYYSGGCFDSTAAFINNIFTYSGTMDEAYFFDTFMKGGFAKGTNRKRLYAGADLVSTINNYQKIKLQTKVEESEYGVDIQKIKSPFGLLELVWHPMLDSTNAGTGILLDMGSDYVKYRYLAGNGKSRDITFREYPGVYEEQDSRKGEWIGEVGWEIQSGEYHAIIKKG